MTSAQIQQLINANAAEQARILVSDEYDDKIGAIRELQNQQKQLFTRRDAAKRDEAGRGPREQVGVRA